MFLEIYVSSKGLRRIIVQITATYLCSIQFILYAELVTRTIDTQLQPATKRVDRISALLHCILVQLVIGDLPFEARQQFLALMTDGGVVGSQVVELVRCLRGVADGRGAVAQGVQDVLVGEDILMLNLSEIVNRIYRIRFSFFRLQYGSKHNAHYLHQLQFFIMSVIFSEFPLKKCRHKLIIQLAATSLSLIKIYNISASK